MGSTASFFTFNGFLPQADHFGQGKHIGHNHFLSVESFITSTVARDVVSTKSRIPRTFLMSLFHAVQLALFFPSFTENEVAHD